MRIAVGGIFHETNTFVADPTTLADFHTYQFAAGPDLLGWRSTRSEIGGFLTGCAAQGWEPLPSLFAAALPAGLVDHAAFDSLTSQLIDGLTSAGRPDGVLLCLHGAMATTQSPDADGEVLTRLAAALGPDVPVVVTLDFHANTGDAMTGNADALLGYDTYPHVDMYDRGLEASGVLAEILRTGQRRRAVHRKVGLITPPQVQYTDLPPMQAIMKRIHDIESAEDVTITVTPGFPYADVDCMGLSVVTSSPDPACAAQVAATVADDVLARAEDFSYEAYPVAEAVRLALAADEPGPVVLVDSADNVGGGGPGDGTAILAEWLAQKGTGLAVVIADPAAVARAVEAGIGAQVRLEIGGHTDNRHGSPIPVTGTLRLISDGTYVHRGSYATGITTRMGRSVVLESSGNTILLTERRVMPFDAQQLLSVGVSPRHCRALVVKSAIAWRAAYGEYASQVIEVDAPGVCTANLRRLDLPEARYGMIRPQVIGQAGGAGRTGAAG
jgi:microcystin degradation protein MlrC